MYDDEQTLADLQAARALITPPERWGKHSFRRDGRFCALGALQAVTDVASEWAAALKHMGLSLSDTEGFVFDIRVSTPRYDRPRLALERAVQEIEGHCYAQVMPFNDHPATTHKQVLELFDRAIEMVGGPLSRARAFSEACAAAARRQHERELSARRFADEAELTVAGD